MVYAMTDICMKNIYEVIDDLSVYIMIFDDI